jgi:hypothetical protein
MSSEVRFQTLLFGVRRSIRYHNRRRRFFDGLNHWKTGLSLVFGSTAMVTILAKVDTAIPLLASALVTVVSTIDLVIGTTAMARLHTELARRFIELERELTLLEEYTDDALGMSTAKRLTIEADEPPIMRVLDILCHNELILARGYDRNELFYVPWYKRLFAHLINLSDESIVQRRQLKQETATPPANAEIS